uniref:Predicted protein n=1 Tax=Hordeum vulgare subsp. vulgare TaxID=112509 RepID=F2CSU2_HORVV|nr:predicted protein [Hordeum vulgare subsp. vulgare]
MAHAPVPAAASHCSYMVLMEKAAFNFRTSYVKSTEFYDTYNGKFPLVMNWRAGRLACEVAQKDMRSYACVSSHSVCVNVTSTNAKPGYRCMCSDGYEGNPYITDGCQDIDECLKAANMCGTGICENTPGNYRCSCHPGYYMTNGVCVSKSKNVAIPAMLVVGLGVGCGFILLSLVFGVLFIKHKLKVLRAKKLREKFFEQNRGLLLEQLVDKDIAERMIFSLEELEKATNKFDEARMLGSGGHGTVYKGILSTQHIVAIKKSKNTIQREIEDFINELAILSQMNHRNVVRMFGCCLETEVPLLIYEFISNGTLSSHLHVEGPQSLSWRDRLRIAFETASSLAYLHSSASMSVIHRDVKSDNILLDDHLTAKVSDFGASRGIPIDQAGVTTAIQGTFGYLDPEYYQTSRLTDKSDVYSFGVILVELLTRKRPNSFRSSDSVSLIAKFNLLMIKDKLFEILDPQVLLEGAPDVEVVAALAATCLRLNGEMRPTMRQVEMRLGRLLGTESNTRHEINDEQNYASFQISNDEGINCSRSFPR